MRSVNRLFLWKGAAVDLSLAFVKAKDSLETENLFGDT